MKALKDLAHTAFISFAQADDQSWFNWVSQFSQELERGLAAILRGVSRPRMFMAGQQGPVTGMLSDELKRHLASSFALIVVVHDHYAQSETCLRELEQFRAEQGQQALQERVYFVAMSQKAMLQVSASPRWKQLLPNDMIWLPFFDAADPERPLDIYMGPGLVSSAFRKPFESLRSDLAQKLRLAAQAIEPVAQSPAPERRAAESSAADLVFISHATEDLAWAQAAAAALEAEGLSCWLAARDIVPGAAAYAGEIAKAIKRSRVMVTLVSRNGSASAHVVREVTLAFDRNLPVIPVKLDAEPLGDSLEYFFTTAQMLMAVGIARDAALVSLLRAVRRYGTA